MSVQWREADVLPPSDFRPLRGVDCQGILPACQEHAMTPEEALMTILRLIDGSEEVQEERLLKLLLRSIKTVAEKGLGREPE